MQQSKIQFRNDLGRSFGCQPTEKKGKKTGMNSWEKCYILLKYLETCNRHISEQTAFYSFTRFELQWETPLISDGSLVNVSDSLKWTMGVGSSLRALDSLVWFWGFLWKFYDNVWENKGWELLVSALSGRGRATVQPALNQQHTAPEGQGKDSRYEREVCSILKATLLNHTLSHHFKQFCLFHQQFILSLF